ncbi:M42 family metallopeptidase [Clostridium sp. UBA1056]|uniref:M42 family metallopeptidase n=1 Tax=unclassified Clostridium TaxID=2614128 RepID=UPI003216F492
MFLDEILQKGGLLDKLTSLSGPSGFEGEVRGFIKEQITSYVDETFIDRMGNIIVHKKGNGRKVVIDAHMDEVGFIITGYNDDGSLRFNALGGINAKIIPSKTVLIGPNKIPGVIGAKPIHLQGAEEREKGLTYNDCCIDIGATSRKQSEDLIELGEYVVFDTEYDEFGEGLVKGKAFDNRVGCFVLMEALKEKYDIDLYGVFTVQEEVGERGAFISSLNLKGDLGIALEGTICADMPSVSKHLRATELGKGPAISIMDLTSIFDIDIADEIMEVGDNLNIPYQRRRAIAGGNDAATFHGTGSGAKIATISVPCRYIHSSVSVASKEDIKNTVKLLVEYLKTL